MSLQIWFALIVEILENKQLVPAIILPKHNPNRSTWETIRKWVSPDLVGKFNYQYFLTQMKIRNYNNYLI